MTVATNRNDHGLEMRRRGLSLLEVVLALSLLVILSSITYWFYSSAMRTRERDIQYADKIRLARVLLDRMAHEIRQATIETADGGVGIDGDMERIRIASLRVPGREIADTRFERTEEPSAEYDLVTVEYRIARHPDILDPEDGYEYPLGLARIERRIPRPEVPGAAAPADESILQTDESGQVSLDPTVLESLLAGDSAEEDNTLETEVNWQELYSQEIRYLRLCYYDGMSWWDDWHVSGENPLPQLILATIGFEAHPPCGEELGQDEDNVEFCECLNREPPDCRPLRPDQYSTTIRVTHADPLFRSRVAREGQDLAKKATQEEESDQGGEGGQ
jgi:prepilin-type N-terminal cleavage/methylation domain-containing protein